MCNILRKQDYEIGVQYNHSLLRSLKGNHIYLLHIVKYIRKMAVLSLRMISSRHPLAERRLDIHGVGRVKNLNIIIENTNTDILRFSQIIIPKDFPRPSDRKQHISVDYVTSE